MFLSKLRFSCEQMLLFAPDFARSLKYDAAELNTKFDAYPAANADGSSCKLIGAVVNQRASA